MQIVVIVAAAALTAVVGPLIAGALGVAAGSLAATAITTATFGALTLAGQFAVNALLPPPSPDQARTGLIGETSPTYSASTQSSVARPGAVIPECFGRHIHLVDDAAPPFIDYVDNIQFLNQLGCLGRGTHAVNEIRLGNTIVWRDGEYTNNLPGVRIEIIEPGTAVTLIDDAVYTQPDVAGQRLEPSVAIGWHAASPIGVDVDAVEIDVGFAQLVDFSSGDDAETSVTITAEAQRLAGDGSPSGDPFTLEELTFTATTRSTLRSSHRYPLPYGRYQVRLTRTTADQGLNVFDDASWIGLKGILPPGRTYGDVQLLAVRVEVGAEVSAQSARRLRVVKTRILPVYSGGSWSAPQPT
ncbi:MAG: hypothetical protein AAGC57_20270, partial [Pseudomonadota bacterium]